MEFNKICVIDGSYMLHRGLKQQHIFNMKSSTLERTGGLYTFLNILQKEMKLLGDYFPIVCFDDGLSKRRLDIDENYKKHKEKQSDETFIPFNMMTQEELDIDYVYNYKLQRKKLIELLNAFGIPTLLYRNTEGDDLMYWLVKHSKKSKIITDDKDLLQMLSETCRVRQPMKDKLVDMNTFLKENNFDNIDEFIKVKSFCGDGSDNIPGCCFRVGEKSAQACIKLYESIRNENNMQLFKDEKLLKEYCIDRNIPFKKAYCNFDEDRYTRNLKLIDLKQIKDNEFNDEMIYNSIRRVYKNNDVHKPMQLLKKYEINTVNITIIFEFIMSTRHNIKESKIIS